MGEPYISGDFVYRDVTPDDKPQVLAFTASTWEHGDYIDQVFDDWLADPDGRFLAAEERSTGIVAAIDKLTMLSPTEAWFEGLRVNPAFRGRGLASTLQRFMIGEAAQLRARSVRLLTLITNLPIHKAAYRDGFTLVGIVRFWKWDQASTQPAPEPQADAFPLRHAAPDEANALYEWWRRASAFQTAGLVHENWTFAETSAGAWQSAASEKRLFVRSDVAIDPEGVPPPAVLVLHDTDDEERPVWVFSAFIALGNQWPSLLRGLIAAAREEGITKMQGLAPDIHDVNAGFTAAGFAGDADQERLCIFELSPIPPQPDLMGKE
ncbi:MAG: GNAT family N-acetyltransferase [Chloroflexota bacterium]